MEHHDTGLEHDAESVRIFFSSKLCLLYWKYIFLPFAATVQITYTLILQNRINNVTWLWTALKVTTL